MNEDSIVFFKREVNRLPNVFFAGCQKTASTWVHRCFSEHPEIYVPERDALNFFTVNYFRGFEWYARFYRDVNGEKAVADTTPSYINDPSSAKRIYRYRPDAKLIFNFRNPVERAFSHYWHVKKKGLTGYAFEEVLSRNGVGSFDLVHTWIRPGFYLELLKPFLDLFPRSRILVLVFDDLIVDPRAFLKTVFEFLKVDSTFEPSVLRRRVNAGLKPGNRESAENEYARGIDPGVQNELIEIYRESIRDLECFLERDLSSWLKAKNPERPAR
jgi:hypothetical protein